jgi:glutamate decarboxylase
MTLSAHIDPDIIEDRIFQDSANKSLLITKYVNKFSKKDKLEKVANIHNSEEVVARFRGVANKYKIPEDGMSPKLAYEMVHDDLSLDGSIELNLASFVNVHTEPESLKLIIENLTKNLADCDEYPMLIELQQRCISIIANLWNAPTEAVDTGIQTPHKSARFSKWKNRAIGTPCTGSSEAIMLGGLAMKKNWQAKRKSKGLPYDKPNILMASCCQVALEKFARYFDVENRLIGVSDKDFLIDINKIKENLDENTIGIFVIVGSTFTGGFENVEYIAQLLDDYEKETGNFIPIHVDGASGGFIAPIIYPSLKWDFRIPRVMSISASGHKFGLVTAGLGWVIFRDETWLPKELKFQLQYLGGLEESFSLNFSRPGYQVVHQYFNLIRFGKRGYYEIFDNCLINARLLSLFLEETGYFTCISNLHLPLGVTTRNRDGNYSATLTHSMIDQHGKFNPALPVVSFQLTKEFIETYPEIPQSLISTLLRNKKWIIPNYQLPRINVPKLNENGEEIDDDDSLLNEANGENNEILRVVVKYNLTAQLLDKLMHDIVEVIEMLIKSVDLVRDNVKSLKENGEEINNELVYNMLLSISNDGDERLIRLKGKKRKHSGKIIC